MHPSNLHCHSKHNHTSTVCWTIHKPKRGWYIRIRAPSFPPGVFISLIPLPRSSPSYTDAGLSFSCRTNAPPDPMSPSSTAKVSEDSMSTVHSYPPTPHAASIMITPQSIKERLEEVPTTSITAQKRASLPQVSKISQFLLAPRSAPSATEPQSGEAMSFITRALSILKSSRPSQTASFALTPFNSSPSAPSAGNRLSQVIPASPTPLLTFHDRTPLLTAASVTGLVEIDRAEERMLGLDTSFLITVALAYWEFLEDREVGILFTGAGRSFRKLL